MSRYISVGRAPRPSVVGKNIGCGGRYYKWMDFAWSGSMTAMLPRRPSLAVTRGLMGLALSKCHKEKVESGRRCC